MNRLDDNPLEEHGIINVNAYDINRNPIHISAAVSGKHGYSCMGCGREVQARKGQIRIHHFSHDPKDALINGKCTYSDETYRHRLAKDILQMNKVVVVPALYVFPPKGTEGMAKCIKPLETISAFTVHNELDFFEDDEGKIRWGRLDKEETSKKHLHIRPDVSFFNNKGEPVLLIELVATNKVDKEKIFKIRSLGLNAIQIKIPKDSEEAIARSLNSTAGTYWLYNHERENTDYFSISASHNSGVQQPDELTSDFSGISETYACRKAGLNNLIRGIRKCLESKSYHSIEGRIRTELQRVKENTRIEQAKRDELEARIADEIRTELDGGEDENRAAREELGNRRKRFHNYRSNLEERYLKKRGILESETKRIEEELIPDIQFGDPKEADRREIEKRLGKRYLPIRDDLENKELRIGFEEEDLRRAENDVKTSIAAIEREEATLGEEFGRKEEGIEEEFRGLEEGIRKASKNKEIQLREGFKNALREIREKEEDVYGRTVKSFEDTDGSDLPDLQRRIRKVFSGREYVGAINEAEHRITCLRKIEEFFRSGNWKNWDEFRKF